MSGHGPECPICPPDNEGRPACPPPTVEEYRAVLAGLVEWDAGVFGGAAGPIWAEARALLERSREP